MYGVAEGSRRNGVLSISPHIMAGDSSPSDRPGIGDGVMSTREYPPILGVSWLPLSLPSMPILAIFVITPGAPGGPIDCFDVVGSLEFDGFIIDVANNSRVFIRVFS